MAIKWRATGTMDIAVKGDMLSISQQVEIYSEAVPTVVIADPTITVSRNLNRVAASPTDELRSIIDNEWIPAATSACLAAKRSTQADGYEAQATSYLATKQASQAGV